MVSETSYHYVLLYDVWVFTHWLYKEHLTNGRAAAAQCDCTLTQHLSRTVTEHVTLKPFCSANWMMVSRLSLVVFVASKTWKIKRKKSPNVVSNLHPVQKISLTSNSPQLALLLWGTVAHRWAQLMHTVCWIHRKPQSWINITFGVKIYYRQFCTNLSSYRLIFNPSSLSGRKNSNDL